MAPAAFPDPSNWPAAKVRSTFIDFFEKTHGHTFWKSASVIPYEDRQSNSSETIELGELNELAHLRRSLVPGQACPL